MTFGPSPVLTSAAAARPETVAPLEALDAALAGRAPPPAPRAARFAPAPARPPSAQSPAPAQRPAPRPVPAPAPVAPSAPAVPTQAPAPALSEAEQLRGLLRSGAIRRGTPQYDAAIQRLADLEG